MLTAIDAFKGLPRRVHIGPFTFRVVVESKHQGHEFLDENDGCCDTNGQRIFVRGDLTLALAINVVQHEISHAINWVYGVTDDSTEEQFTNQHSNGQIEVWLRNPRLWNWFAKQLRVLRKEASHD